MTRAIAAVIILVAVLWLVVWVARVVIERAEWRARAVRAEGERDEAAHMPTIRDWQQEDDRDR